MTQMWVYMYRVMTWYISQQRKLIHPVYYETFIRNNPSHRIEHYYTTISDYYCIMVKMLIVMI